MTDDRRENTFTGAVPLELDEKSLLGSSYSYQLETSQPSGASGHDMDKSEDD